MGARLNNRRPFPASNRNSPTQLSPRLATILALIVLVPLGLLGWLGGKLAKEEQARIQDSLQNLMHQRLADLDQTALKVTGNIEREILGMAQLTKGMPTGANLQERLRQMARENRFPRQIFVRSPDQTFLHPPKETDRMTDQEKAFFERTKSVWESGVQFYTPSNDASQSAEQHGWHAWFWGERINFLIWLQLPDGHLFGTELDTAALLAELIGQLPSEGTPDANIRLVDASGGILYRWGDSEPAQPTLPEAETMLSPPLQMWKLQYFAKSVPTGSGALPFHILASLLAVGIALVGLAIYFYLENTRELRVASHRVSFVNQVSHELKTPLTNIRMYADLLEGQLPEDLPGAHKHLKVITDESRRLSRLIQNVLTFGRSQRQELQLHKTSRTPDVIVLAVLENFRPALETRDFEIHLDLQAGEPMEFDADILEQILGNLISNVEKYGVKGKYVGIATKQTGGSLEIHVTDKGPGIPPAHREEVFRPFHRLSSDLSEGVSGTGIGLPIARDLSRLHGGDLTILDAKEGTTFLLTLK
jgi:signal transduction histidine kinase